MRSGSFVATSALSMDELVAVLCVAVNDDFAVRAGLEMMSLRFEFTTQLAKVVDLAIAHQPDRAIVVRKRLVATGEIDD